MTSFTSLTEGTGLFEELLKALKDNPGYELWVSLINYKIKIA
jgi:hypothetical protein